MLLHLQRLWNTRTNQLHIWKYARQTQFVRLLQESGARKSERLPFEVDSNVAKDVMLFKYENPRFYRNLNVFAICQFMFWTYLSHTAFTSLRDVKVKLPPEDGGSEELPWWRKINLGEKKYRNGITIACFSMGYLILATSWLFTMRSIRFLILRKAGKTVTFVTYGPFGKNRMFTVPLKDISCLDSRHSIRTQLPIKVRNNIWYYILDMKGTFTNPKLFDQTVGLNRSFK